ncbi:EAL domain-containing protein, partial [Yersinia intermedia]
EFAVSFTALRSFWLQTFWPIQWAINLLVLLSYSVLFYGYARHRLSLCNAIRRALQRKAFCVHYQPIVEIKTGRIQSLEALIRWPTAAGQFIP